MPTVNPVPARPPVFTVAFYREARRMEYTLRRQGANAQGWRDNLTNLADSTTATRHYGGTAESRRAWLTARWGTRLTNAAPQHYDTAQMPEEHRNTYQQLRRYYNASFNQRHLPGRRRIEIERNARQGITQPPSLERCEALLCWLAANVHFVERHTLPYSTIQASDPALSDALNRRGFQICAHCRAIGMLDEDTLICETCERETSTCCNCGRRERNNRMDEEGYCPRCRDSENRDGVSEYHSTPRRAQTRGLVRHVIEYGPNDNQRTELPIYMGLELETEFRGGSQLSNTLPNLRRGGLICERDGSLGSYGCELVTHFGPVHYSLSAMRHACETIGHNARSHRTDTCGLHVNISKADADLATLARICVLWHSEHNRGFLQSFARRWSTSGYAKHRPEKGAYAEPIDRLALNSDRYELVNFQPSNRFEVRAFRGTLRYETLEACAVLAHAIGIYCRFVAEDPAKLTWEALLAWLPHYKVTAEYANGETHTTDASSVIAYAKSKGFSLDAPPENPEGEEELDEDTTSATAEA